MDVPVDGYEIMTPPKWTWDNALNTIITFVLLFLTFVSNFESEFYYFFLGKTISTLVVTILVLFDTFA